MSSASAPTAPQPRPMPTAWVGARLLSDLFSRQMQAKACKPFAWETTACGYALYTSDRHKPLALGLCDLSATCWFGAALAQIPHTVAQESIGSGIPSPTLLENFREVMNVVARLLVYPEAPHIRLGPSGFAQGGYRDHAPQVASAASKLAWEVKLTDYGLGKMLLLDLSPM